MHPISQLKPRLFFVLLGALGLFSVYFFQEQLDVYAVLMGESPQRLDIRSEYRDVDPWSFGVNKLARYLLNDLFAMSLVYGLFYERKFLRFTVGVLLFGLFILLPLYIFLYLSQPPGLSSMVGHLHRLVLNPVLMMLLIPAFYYQKVLKPSRT